MNIEENNYQIYKDFFETCFSYNEDYRGYVIIKTKGKFGRMKTVTAVRADKLMEQLRQLEFKKQDYYIARARFKSPSNATQKNVFGLNTIVVDIDNKMAHNKLEQTTGLMELKPLLGFLEEEFRNADGIHMCNFAVLTGRGVQLWWALDPIPNQVSYYHIILDRIYEVLDGVLSMPGFSRFQIDKAASANHAGLARFPGTYNSKSKTTGDIIEYHLDSLSVGEFVEDPDAWKKQTAETTETVQYKYRRPTRRETLSKTKTPEEIQKLLQQEAKGRACMFSSTRLEALKKLIDIRNNSDGNTGSRNNLLFVAALCFKNMEYTDEDIKKGMEELNARFDAPLESSEVNVIFRSAMRRIWKISNAKIYELLNITEEEGLQINLVKNPQYKRGNRRILTQAEREEREKAYDERMQKIEALLEQGYSVYAISKEIHLDKMQVKVLMDRHGLQTKQHKLEEQIKKDIKKGYGQEACIKKYNITERKFLNLEKKVKEEKKKKRELEEEKRKRQKEKAVKQTCMRAFREKMDIQTVAKNYKIPLETVQAMFEIWRGKEDRKIEFLKAQEDRLTKEQKARLSKKIEDCYQFVEDEGEDSVFGRQVANSLRLVEALQKNAQARWKREKEEEKEFMLGTNHALAGV